MRTQRLSVVAAAFAVTAALGTVATPPAGAVTDPVHAVVSAAGQRQWLSCVGTGSPTVVIASGLGADHTMWSRVLAPMRRTTRVCISDRPGLGGSPPRTGSRTTDAGEHATELRALLATAGEAGPYLLVGHSYGGLVVRAFAAADPMAVAGMLLVDAVYPGIQRTFLPSYRGPWHEGGTLIDMDASEAATAGGPDLGDSPLLVLTAGRPGNGSTWADRRWNREQAAAMRLSSNSRHWFARRSGHVIQHDQPRIVVRAVDTLVADIRRSAPDP